MSATAMMAVITSRRYASAISLKYCGGNVFNAAAFAISRVCDRSLGFAKAPSPSGSTRRITVKKLGDTPEFHR